MKGAKVVFLFDLVKIIFFRLRSNGFRLSCCWNCGHRCCLSCCGCFLRCSCCPNCDCCLSCYCCCRCCSFHWSCGCCSTSCFCCNCPMRTSCFCCSCPSWKVCCSIGFAGAHIPNLNATGGCCWARCRFGVRCFGCFGCSGGWRFGCRWGVH